MDQLSFPGLDGVSYLNCASQGPLPSVAIDAATAAIALKSAPHRIRDEDYFAYPDGYRDAVGTLVNAEAENIAVTDSATHGIMLVVRGLEWSAGDEVIIPTGEFPSNRFPWRSLESRGVVVKEIDVGAGPEGVERVASAISARTRVVSASWVGFSTGVRRDLRGLGALCRSHGIIFLVDGSQAVGGLPLDLADTPCDLLVSAGYKWLLGPFGLGFAYVAPALAARLEPGLVNWFALQGARDFGQLSRCAYAFTPGARRFDVNETANFFNVAAGTASIRALIRVTPDVVHAHARTLIDRTLRGLPAGFRPAAEPAGDRSNILCIRGADAETTAAAYRRLREHHVYVARREQDLRISPHLCSSVADVDHLLDVLARKDATTVTVPGPDDAFPVGPPVAETGVMARPGVGPYTGDRIVLRRVEPDDAHVLYAGSHGDAERERIWTYLPYGPFDGEATMATWLRDCRASEDPLFLTVLDRATSTPVGMVSFMRIDHKSRSVELGHIWYTPAAQRGHTNTEAMSLMMREAFDRLHARRVEWKCDALNARSRAAALRLGFRFEGLFRQHVIVKGRNRDTAWYSMVDGEWPAARDALERWLARRDADRPSLATIRGE